MGFFVIFLPTLLQKTTCTCGALLKFNAKMKFAGTLQDFYHLKFLIYFMNAWYQIASSIFKFENVTQIEASKLANLHVN